MASTGSTPGYLSNSFAPVWLSTQCVWIFSLKQWISFKNLMKCHLQTRLKNEKRVLKLGAHFHLHCSHWDFPNQTRHFRSAIQIDSWFSMTIFCYILLLTKPCFSQSVFSRKKIIDHCVFGGAIQADIFVPVLAFISSTMRSDFCISASVWPLWPGRVW